MRVFFDDAGEFQIDNGNKTIYVDKDFKAKEEVWVFGTVVHLEDVVTIKVLEAKAPEMVMEIKNLPDLRVPFKTVRDACNCAQFLFITAVVMGNLTIKIPVMPRRE